MDSSDIIERKPAFAVFHFPSGGLEIGGTSLQITANRRAGVTRSVIGGGSAIAGTKGFVGASSACLVSAAQMPADRAGSTADVWKDADADYYPIDADSIRGAVPPTGAAARSGRAGLTGWTSSIAIGGFADGHVDGARPVRHGSIVLTADVS
jgi:hypothetical protein